MIDRYNIISTILLSLSCLILSGCSQHYAVRNDGKQARAAPYTIVSSGKSSVNVALATTYTFVSDRHESHGVPTLGGIPIKVYIDTGVDRAMTAKGYRFVRIADEHSLLVRYQLALGDAQAGEQLGKRVGMQPGLPAGMPGVNHFEKGTLVITVTDNRSGRTALRSALEGFADLNIPARVRQQRINDIVKRMLSGLPLQGH